MLSQDMWPFGRTLRVEDPERLSRFLDALGTNWQNDPKDQFDRLFNAVNELAHHEILFYYRARKKQRRFSIVTRGLAILFGTAGVMAPLLAGANPDIFKGWSAYGYPLLALAAAMIVINRLFGATGGHIRYVTAQLELERVLTTFRLDWSEWRARYSSVPDTDKLYADGFAVLRSFCNALYKTIQEETNVWGKSVSEALQEYASTIAAQRKLPGTSASVEPTKPPA